MKIVTVCLLLLLSLPGLAGAEEDDSKPAKTVKIEGGKFVGEEHEIEIYDYHSGVYQSVTVYRTPQKADKTQEPAAQPAEQPKR
ncbi:hypothetical protein A1507_01985 [Methylomonas koyamae]|uniref:DUF2782 domain-containing protein n=1 Tax=Methylomonas koyamae TaxID=702114 RepID=A0A177N2T8_9GAMM|nr:hypothetical protein [Methylomonas koyamae]OAI12286.1 hypothetical protein A1507_01985 [Methylomonas koyamae]